MSLTDKQYDVLKEFFRELFADANKAEVERHTDVHYGYRAVTINLRGPEQVVVYFSSRDS